MTLLFRLTSLILLLVVAGAAGTAAPMELEPLPSPPIRKILDGAIGKLQGGDVPGGRVELDRAATAARKAADVPGEAMSRWVRGILHRDTGQPEKALEEFRAAVALWKRIGNGPGQASLLCGMARMIAAREPVEARRLVGEAAGLARAERARPLAMATILNDAGVLLYQSGLVPEARTALDAAAFLRARHAAGSEPLANTLSNLANTEADLGVLGPAREHLEQSLGIYRKFRPGSPDEARVLTNLGLVLHQQGELRPARDAHREAVNIIRVAEPGSPWLPLCLNNLGAAQYLMGDFGNAKASLDEALDLHRKMSGPAGLGPAAAEALDTLGLLERARGRLGIARGHLLEALRIRETAAPDSAREAASLANLGATCWLQGDLDGAETLTDRSCRILALRLPGSQRLALALGNLGGIRLRAGDVDGARKLLLESLEIHRKADPNSAEVTSTLVNLGTLELAHGDAARAAEFLRQALTLEERVTPDSHRVGMILNNLGAVALEAKQLEEARTYLRRALNLKENAGETADLARTLSSLARLAHEDRDHAEALRLAERAWKIVLEQSAGVTGDEARQAFAASTVDTGLDLIEFQVGAGRPREALHTLDQSRARALRQAMSERLAEGPRMPSAAWDAYRGATRARDEAGRRLAAAEVVKERGAERLEEMRREYARARVEAQLRWDELSAAAPELFPAYPPTALDPAALPEGTLLVAFAVGEKQTFLLAAQGGEAPEVTAFALPLGQEALAERVGGFRRLVTGSGSEVRGARLVRTLGERGALERVRQTGGELYRELFPARLRRLLSAAGRVVILPDGPLWDLPFACLPLAEGPDADADAPFLGLTHPLVYAQSVSLFLESMRSVGHERPRSALVIGNPAWTAAPNGGERQLLFGGPSAPAALPAAEREAAEVARLYGAEALTGARATEASLRRQLPDADIIHLATHGLLHPFRALSSGLLLAGDGASTEDDGALQAWEVAGQLRLKAQLVVLSACETGLGYQARGEGLVGLTRAFQIAGARSVAASQWKVADGATGDLMTRFHQELRAGTPKDEALRRAMSAIAGEAATGHPFYWGAFVLVGDPR